MMNMVNNTLHYNRIQAHHSLIGTTMLMKREIIIFLLASSLMRN